MREKVIALIVCLMIFVTVLIVGVTTAARSSARQHKPAQPKVSTQQEITKNITTAQPAKIQVPPAPVKKYRFKRSDRRANPTPFDFSSAVQLPKSFAKYRYSAGILVDLDSRKVLWQQSSQKAVPIASLTKLLTIYTAFEELEKRDEINLKTRVTVSLESAGADKVKMNLKPGEKIPLNELFIYAMLKSANDAAHQIAEYFGNGENDLFIKKMNRYAHIIGMSESRFYNANGLPIYGKTPEQTLMNKIMANQKK